MRTHHSLSLDGYSATTEGLPAITQVTESAPKKTHGIPEFGADCSAVAMGRTTFEPAIGNPWWPWPGKRVYVLSSRELPAGTPDDVVHVPAGVDALLERLRSDDFEGDPEILSGPSLTRACWQRRHRSARPHTAADYAGRRPAALSAPGRTRLVTTAPGVTHATSGWFHRALRRATR